MGAGASAWLTGTTIFANALGLQTLGTGTIADLGDNQLIGNTVDGAPTTKVQTTGPAGPAGPAGAAGPQGEPGGAAARRRGGADASSPGRARASSLRYLSSAAAAATLTVSRAGKRVARVRGTARAGANTIRWSGKSGRKAARAGRYVLTLRAVAADGQVSSATAKLTLRRPR